MKRFLCAVFALMLLCTTALSEGFDLSTMTDDELLALKEAVDSEVDSRGLLTSEYEPWDEYGLAQYLPSLSKIVGRELKSSVYGYNFDTSFAGNFEGMSRGDFDEYVKALKAYGYINEASSSPYSFEGTNDDGIKVSAFLIGDSITISAYKVD